MAFFTGFGPRRAAGLAEQPKFLFAIVIWHLNEHSVRVSALNSKILSLSTPFCVVGGGSSDPILGNYGNGPSAAARQAGAEKYNYGLFSYTLFKRPVGPRKFF